MNLLQGEAPSPGVAEVAAGATAGEGRVATEARAAVKHRSFPALGVRYQYELTFMSVQEWEVCREMGR